MTGVPAPSGQSALAATLARVRDALAGAQGAYWIIGSAAVVLHGARTSVADVDVLCADPANARALIETLTGEVLDETGGALFRSAVFGRCGATSLPIEVMAGFAVRGVPVILATREWREIGGVAVPVPSRVELIALLDRFGREKDLARAALLRG